MKRERKEKKGRKEERITIIINTHAFVLALLMHWMKKVRKEEHSIE